MKQIKTKSAEEETKENKIIGLDQELVIDEELFVLEVGKFVNATKVDDWSKKFNHFWKKIGIDLQEIINKIENEIDIKTLKAELESIRISDSTKKVAKKSVKSWKR